MAGGERRILAIALSVAGGLCGLVMLLGGYIQNSNDGRLARLELDNKHCHERIDKAENYMAAATVRLEFIQRDVSKVLAAIEVIQKKMNDDG